MLWWTLRQLKSGDSRVAERAALELGAAKEPRAVEPLLRALGSRHEKLRYAAARALAEIGDPRAVEPLIEAFRAEPADAYCRALIVFKDQRAIEPLIDAVVQGDEPVQQLAARTLDLIDANWAQSPAAKATAPKLHEALQQPNLEVKQAALDVLVKIGGQRTLEALLQVIEREVESTGWAVRALDRTEPGWTRLPEAKSAVPSLVALLKGQSFERELAAVALADIGDTRAVEPLIDALRDRSRDLRTAAARALGKLGDRRAIRPILTGPLRGFLDPWVAQQALNGIDPKWAESAEAREAVPDCLEKLADTDKGLREYAGETLKRIDPNWAKSAIARDAVPLFEQRLKHSDSHVREAAAKALAQIDAARA